METLDQSTQARSALAELSSLSSLSSMEELATYAAHCRACGLREQSDAVTFADGDPASPIAIVGMNPGFCEDATGIPFCGREELARSRCVQCLHYSTCFSWQTDLGASRPLRRSCLGYTPHGGAPATPPLQVSVGGYTLGGVRSAGQLLDDALHALGIRRDRLFLTNVALCKSAAGDPRPDHIAACRPIRLRAHALQRPAVIVALGRLAIHEYIPLPGFTLAAHHGTLHTWRGNDGLAVSIVPTYHPAAILRGMLEISRTPTPTARAQAQIRLQKWALYCDLALAFNTLGPAELQGLLCEGILLQNGKLPVRKAPSGTP